MATTSLFTDIVGSTEKAVEVGDAAWAELLERHHALVRTEITHFGGEEMDTSGDGFFAIFPDPVHAIDAADAIRRVVGPLGLRVRIGIHHGDCWVADGKCTGVAVHIGARIAELAGAEEIYVSEAAKTAGEPGHRFAARGAHILKGIPGSWQLYAVERPKTSSAGR
jgi:class 3 adenylate cyclase